MKWWLTIFILFFSVNITKAQTPSGEVIIHAPNDLEKVWSRYSRSVEYNGDSLNLIRQLHKVVSEIRSEGYLLANLDSITLDREANKAETWVFIGNKFDWGNISFRSNSVFFKQARENYNEKWTGKEVSIHRIESALKKIIRIHENNGYPFASLRWDSIYISGERISAALFLDTGPFISFDSLKITGNVSIRKMFLASYLNVLPGQPFSQKAIDNIPERLTNIEYLNLHSYPGITFQNEEVTITLDLEKRKANRFDAIIGFFPNENEGEGVLVTGMVELALNNLFQSGKQLDFHWDRLQKSTQTLSIGYIHPNLLRSPLGLVTNFFLYKQDSAFLNRKMLLGIDLKTGKYGKTWIQSEWESSRLISTSQFQNAVTLPDVADYNISYVGVGFSTLSQRGLTNISERKWGIYLKSMAGNKVIRENSNLSDELYDGIDSRTFQFSLKGLLEGIYPFSSGPFAIYGRVSAGKLINDRLFLNDLFRLGGLNSIRGFNENTFYASGFITGTVELQTYFNEQSRIFIFYDQGYFNYNLENSNFSDAPLGAGLGLSVQTTNGLFSFVYALGKSKEQAFGMRYSKIHFGYKAIF